METIWVKFEEGVFKPLRNVLSLQEGTLGEVRIKKKPPKRRSVKASKFFGLWKDRGDIRDGFSYVLEIRSKLRY